MAAKVIILASRKGGAGKTTVLCNLAATLSYKGKVLIIDCDNLGGASDWAMIRTETKLPAVTASVARPEKGLLAKIEGLKSNFDYILIDTPGHDAGGNRYVYSAADLLIFPLKPSTLDLKTRAWIKELIGLYTGLKPELSVALVLNECLSSSKRETRDAVAFLSEEGLSPLDNVLHTRISYRDVQNQGLGVAESKDRKAADEFARLFAKLMKPIRATSSHSSATMLDNV